MKPSTNKFFVAATGAAFAAGVLIRFAALARVPLSDAEAGLALQAFDLARGQVPVTIIQPAYLSLTTLVFFLFGSSDFLARFWPALVGSLMVLVPLLYRRFLGPVAVLIVMWLIALDPGLVAVSRSASGTIFAVAFTLMAAGFYLNLRPVWTGFCVALALMSGPQLWPGLIILGLALLRASGWRLKRTRQAQNEDATRVAPDGAAGLRLDLRVGLAAGLLTLLLVGTLFFRYPVIVTGIPSSLMAYLRGWFETGGVSLGLMLAALLFYEAFVLLAGLTGLIRDLVRRVLGLAGIAFLVALALVLAYPSRQSSDLVWVTLPLAVQAAVLLEKWLLPEEISLAPVIAETLLTFVLLIFAYMNLTALAGPLVEEPSLRLAAMWSAVGLLLITSVLMVWGWSLLSMRTGLTYGLVLLLSLFTISAAVNAAGLGRNPQAEMWQSSDPVVDADLLRGTVGDLALWTRGDRDIIDVSVVGVDSPALRWVLRRVSQLRFMDYLPQETQPAIVITPVEQTINIANAYSGQDFVWTRRPDWSNYLEAEWLRWLTGRQAHAEDTHLILWARTDLFPGGMVQPAETTP